MSELKVSTCSYRVTIHGCSEFFYGYIATLNGDHLILRTEGGIIGFICKLKDIELFQLIPDPSFKTDKPA